MPINLLGTELGLVEMVELKKKYRKFGGEQNDNI
jgi:hypothetical protein